MSQEPEVAAGVDMASIEALLESLKVEGYEDAALAEARNPDGSRKTVACWAHRGCEGLMGLTEPMERECPHSREDCYSPCPAECKYTACMRPWHRTATDFNLILDDTVDRMAAVKQACQVCEYFLKHAPRVGEGASDGRVLPETATSDAGGVTIHLF